MIVVKTENGFEQVWGNPTLTSLDGEQRAPLKAILSLDKTDQERFGIFQLEDEPVPTGKVVVTERIEDAKGLPIRIREYTDAPSEPPLPSRAEKFEQLCYSFGLTPAEFIAELAARNGEREIRT